MLLIIDNYDSFTYNLLDYFEQLGEECIVKKNDVSIDDIDFEFDRLLLSPGPGIPENSGNLMEILEYYHDKVPILGICLGHQAIGEFFGASLKHAIKPMHGKISEIEREEDNLFKNLPQKYKVVRYHSLVLEDIPDCLEVIAHTSEQEIMAIKHKELDIRGIQFHPEAILTEFGIEILKNWIETSGKNTQLKHFINLES